MSEATKEVTLSRVISLPLLVLYGLGVTIGAGIYVLVGQTAAQAGMYAPMSFIVAAIVMAFSAGTFAELSVRFPQSAGEAIYVKEGLRSEGLSLLTGGIVLMSATVAAATITLGGTGYVLELLGFQREIVIVSIVLLMGGVAAWGVKQSVIFAAVFTVLEILGLLVIIVAGFWTQPDLMARLPEVIPPIGDTAALTAIFTTSLIAFFAFIGFDDVVNLVEETKNPARTMPLAILIVLVVATVLYFMVTAVAVLTVPLENLATSQAPIGLLFERLTGSSPLMITLIAIVATLNGIVIQIVMAARVLYGLGKKGSIPKVFASIHPKTRTPVVSTVLVTGVILGLALFFPIQALAEMTTQFILTVFTFVNLSLAVLKIRSVPAPEGAYSVGIWVPIGGVVACLLLLVGPRVLL
ncbi:amino acid permease [Rhodobacterales bacterium 52_120_T64]|nr:amino acid permease [Rhodobacterales bacterium 52_120_T64]